LPRLATINLSAVSNWDYPLKTLPRPSGRATRAIVTEYDVRRPTTQPHDVLLDKNGNVWYPTSASCSFPSSIRRRSSSRNNQRARHGSRPAAARHSENLARARTAARRPASPASHYCNEIKPVPKGCQRIAYDEACQQVFSESPKVGDINWN
jgi:hypothetical protein